VKKQRTNPKYYDEVIDKENDVDDFLRQTDFIRLLVTNKLKTPNEFTEKMGKLIKQAREEMGISQAELAKKLYRRQATISEIENGKSEIGILTLVQFAFVMRKPIMYFFPQSLLKHEISDVKSTFEQKVVELARQIEEYEGDEELTLELLLSLKKRFEKAYYDERK
jgi:transcriptional regulator with XRE-family HTH domain